ncbi:hypothetical protein SAMN04488040_1513 [Sulfitobacter marinus]|uniref:Uncharacterized protein n=1 Tax=Sulfitobacter marinus TaxID=394264 RepID=A0A1I6RUD2_9RHOB|nr:hypothetical protein SAMN04488040_1513 [Sulfitobacter marinus]
MFGTDQPAVTGTPLACAPWAFTLEAGSLRHIKLNGTEAIRSIAFLVRDRDWGTLVPQIQDEVISQTDAGLRIAYTATYTNGPAQLIVDIEVEVTAGQLSMRADGITKGDFETNRAGFTVLHPIDGVAGQPVHVGHSDGTLEETTFPMLIEPWQPFMDIASLTHTVGDYSVTCRLEGDTFEMEDQRQWGDASYKTYNRPLAKPWPYQITEGDGLAQSVVLSIGAPLPYARSRPEPQTSSEAIFPDMALVVTPEDARRLAGSPSDLAGVNPQRLLCHLDMELGGLEAQIQAFATAQSACPDVLFDLELILACADTPAAELGAVAAHIQAFGLVPASVTVCPSADRQSTPPGSDWPDCPPLEDIHRAAADAFPDVMLGGGMVSFFPELNRKRPPLKMLDFVSHGLCPIVHAADDISVMETLETIPHITRSARAIFDDMQYRIGPATIAMRQNPYGNRVIPNPDAQRVCMTDDDPRHRGQFGAAYVMGLATALAAANVAVWTPAAIYGPRGIGFVGTTGQSDWPITQALAMLASLAGQVVKGAQISDGIAKLSVGTTVITANLTPEDNGDLSPFEWRAVD